MAEKSESSGTEVGAVRIPIDGDNESFKRVATDTLKRTEEMSDGVIRAIASMAARTGKSFEEVAAKAKEAAGAKKEVAEESQKTEKAAAGASSVLAKLPGIYGKIAAFAVDFIEKILKSNEALIKLDISAQRAGASLEQFAVFQKVAFVAGNVDAETFASSMATLNRKIQEAVRDGNELTKWAKENKIELRNVNGEIKTAIELLPEIGKLMRGAVNATDQDVRILQEDLASAFGLNSAFIRMLTDSPEKLAELTAHFKKFGGASKEAIEKATQAQREWNKLVVDTEQFLKDAEKAANDFAEGVAKWGGARVTAGLTKIVSLMGEMRDGMSLLDQRVRDTTHFDLMVQNATKAFTDPKMLKALEDFGKKRAAALGLIDVVPPPEELPVPKRPPKDDEEKAEKEGFKRRFLAFQQHIANEAEALSAHRDKMINDARLFHEREFLDEEEHRKALAKIEAKFQKEVRDFAFRNFDQNFMTEKEVMARQDTERLTKLTQFEEAQRGFLETKHAEKMESLKARHEEELIQLVGFEEAKAVLERKFQEDKTALEEEQGERRRRLQEKQAQNAILMQARQWSGLANIVDTSMGHISKILGEEGKKGFTITKAVATATALVKGYETVVSAMAAGMAAGGPPVAAAFGAIAAAGVAAQIAAIHATQPGSGGNVSAPAAGGSVTTTTSAAPEAGGATAGPSRTLFVRGMTSPMYSREAVRDLAEQLIEFQRDGGRVVLADG